MPHSHAFRILAGSLMAFSIVSRPAVAEPPSKDYELLYEENFQGNAVNEADWIYRTGRRDGGNLNGLNLPQNVTISDGMLHVAVRQEMIDGKLENTGGGLISKHQFGYGYYECLSKPFMAGTGVHSSFWQSRGAFDNNDIFEIDGYEIDSKSNLGCNNLYIHLAPQPYNQVPWPVRANVPFTLNDGWYLDGYEYTPEGVIFYNNGKEVARVEWEELTAAQVVWLTGLNGCGAVESDKQPGESLFKYFRYYTKDYPGINLLPNGNFEYNQDRIDPATPIAWRQEGTEGASRLIRGEAARDQYKLRQGREDAPSSVKTWQTLEFIRNGEYRLSAMVRSSGGQSQAQLAVLGYGGKELALDLPASKNWKRVEIPSIAVSNHCATIMVRSQSAAGQWLEIDDIQFMKPALPGQPVPAPKPFSLIGDPIWKVGLKRPIAFTGDKKFYFFDRIVGFGDSITVSFLMKPESDQPCSPIARIPAKGKDGWAVLLGPEGSLVFRIGSGENHRDVIAPKAWKAGREIRATCVFDRGTARIYANGKLLKTVSGITQTTKDPTKAGKMGAVGDTFEAVGDVTVSTGDSKPSKSGNYVGTLADVRVYNRALSKSEVAALRMPSRER